MALPALQALPAAPAAAPPVAVVAAVAPAAGVAIQALPAYVNAQPQAAQGALNALVFPETRLVQNVAPVPVPAAHNIRCFLSYDFNRAFGEQNGLNRGNQFAQQVKQRLENAGAWNGGVPWLLRGGDWTCYYKDFSSAAAGVADGSAIWNEIKDIITGGAADDGLSLLGKIHVETYAAWSMHANPTQSVCNSIRGTNEYKTALTAMRTAAATTAVNSVNAKLVTAHGLATQARASAVEAHTAATAANGAAVAAALAAVAPPAAVNANAAAAIHAANQAIAFAAAAAGAIPAGNVAAAMQANHQAGVAAQTATAAANATAAAAAPPPPPPAPTAAQIAAANRARDAVGRFLPNP